MAKGDLLVRQSRRMPSPDVEPPLHCKESAFAVVYQLLGAVDRRQRRVGMLLATVGDVAARIAAPIR